MSDKEKLGEGSSAGKEALPTDLIKRACRDLAVQGREVKVAIVDLKHPSQE